MIERLDIVEQRYNEITKLLQDPSVTSDINKYRELSKELSSIEETVNCYHEYKSTLEDFLETDIKYYVRVNFDSVVEIIDTIGGVDINNDVEFSNGKYHFAKGNIHLNGKEALAYSRDRYHQASGDWSRGQHQMIVIQAIINKITHSTELLTNYATLVDQLSSFVQTNVEDSEIRKYVKKQLNDMSDWNVYNNAVSGIGYDLQETYSAPGIKLYVTHPEEASRVYSSKLINGILNGKEYNDIK